MHACTNARSDLQRSFDLLLRYWHGHRAVDGLDLARAKICLRAAGCAAGLTKNFAALVEVLGGFAEVRQAGAEAEEQRAAPAEAQVTLYSALCWLH